MANKNNLNKSEESLLQKVQSMYCKDELEIDHIYAGDAEDVTVDGWYPFNYNANREEAVPFDAPNFGPVITDEEAEKKHIDVKKVLSKAGCYYVG